ncbi:L-glutamine synthetase [Acidothermus cellulolyticus 11B]|uniref:L-glutamine synthetase n=1 Tax=Acidothermus cellulolyticus (strain ATCC 43068 / DSM 8971 / 11B) TaxID=351607 RepID=A0LTV8_ACIC1|nr:glutamine synthetase family protein [Acidothermus cellulolyticus]ABK52868.1 L-glutamine synthetase [Acidothermus cellulolyticus 11B]
MQSDDQRNVERLTEQLRSEGIDVLRIGYADLIGTERGRDLVVETLAHHLGEGGIAFCRGVFHTSPRGDVVPVAGGLDAGLPDVLAKPDLSTVRKIPWEDGVAHVLADIVEPDGRPCAESPRSVLRSVVGRCEAENLVPVVGPEMEFYLLEGSSSSGWRRYGEAPGNVYVAGRKGDPENLLLEFLRQLARYGIRATAGNHEFFSGQFEINIGHSHALDAADRAFRFRTAVKELARRAGKHATFMAKPFNEEGGSGFHLHFSIVDPSDRSLFADEAAPTGLSSLAEHAVAGILAHAPALAAFNNPTINSYKRFGPDTLASWLIDWGLDNRSTMVRIPPERGDATRIEVRLGDATANPYLAIASVVAGAYLGIEEKLTPPPPTEGYGYDASRSRLLPRNLEAALDALEADTELTEILGKPLISAFVTYKRNELERFAHYVTDWEVGEYLYHL